MWMRFSGKSEHLSVSSDIAGRPQSNRAHAACFRVGLERELDVRTGPFEEN